MTAQSPAALAAQPPAQLPVGDLGVAATLDAAGDIVRLDWKLYGAIAFFVIAPFQAVFAILVGILNPQTMPYHSVSYVFDVLNHPEEAAAVPPGDAFLATALSLAFSVLFGGVLVPFATGAVARAAALRYLGHAAAVRDCLRWAWRHLLKLVFTHFLFLLTLLAVFIAAAIISFLPMLTVRFFAGNVGSNLIVVVSVLAVVGGAALIIAILVARLRLGLFYAAMAVEDLAYGAAIGRSYRLSRGRFNRVMWISAVLYLAVSYLSIGVNAIPNVFAYGLLTSIAASAGVVVEAVAMTVFYFNCRALHENLDIFLLAERGRALAGAATGAGTGAATGGANG